MELTLLIPVSLIFLLLSVHSQVTFQNPKGTFLRVDTGSYGPAIEEVHYFYQDWPVGFAVSSTGRIFVSYYPGNVSFTLGEVVNSTSEMAYLPQFHLSSQNLTQTIDGTLLGSQNTSAFISVQALYVTPKSDTRSEMLWVLDTGRPNYGPQMASSLPGILYHFNTVLRVDKLY